MQDVRREALKRRSSSECPRRSTNVYRSARIGASCLQRNLRKGDPHPQHMALQIRIVVVLVFLPCVKDRVVVDELHIAFLEEHAQPEFRTVGDFLDEIESFALDVREGELLAEHASRRRSRRGW